MSRNLIIVSKLMLDFTNIYKTLGYPRKEAKTFQINLRKFILMSLDNYYKFNQPIIQTQDNNKFIEFLKMIQNKDKETSKILKALLPVENKIVETPFFQKWLQKYKSYNRLA